MMLMGSMMAVKKALTRTTYVQKILHVTAVNFQAETDEVAKFSRMLQIAVAQQAIAVHAVQVKFAAQRQLIAKLYVNAVEGKQGSEDQQQLQAQIVRFFCDPSEPGPQKSQLVYAVAFAPKKTLANLPPPEQLITSGFEVRHCGSSVECSIVCNTHIVSLPVM
jgi:hypothetical protein